MPKAEQAFDPNFVKINLNFSSTPQQKKESDGKNLLSKPKLSQFAKMRKSNKDTVKQNLKQVSNPITLVDKPKNKGSSKTLINNDIGYISEEDSQITATPILENLKSEKVESKFAMLNNVHKLKIDGSPKRENGDTAIEQ